MISSPDADIIEGFLCPVCLQDLKNINYLQEHFEEKHSEDKDVIDSIKGS